MSDTITIQHHGVEIVYLERENRFQAVIRGRERSFESLAKAKEAIDKPDPQEKEAFKRAPIWYARYQGTPVEAEVTSLAEKPSYGDGNFFWISSEGRRQKEPQRSLFERSESNDAIVKQMAQLDSDIEGLQKKRNKLFEGLKHFKPTTT